MKPFPIALIGTVVGTAGYAICALVFWYYSYVSPAIALAFTIGGIGFLVLGAVSALAAIAILMLMIVHKIENWQHRHG